VSELDFDTVYSEHARFVYRSLCRLGVPSEHIADATQDVFVVVHRKLAEFENRSSVRTWLFGIALRVAKDWTRKERRRPSEPLPQSLPDERREAPFEVAARSEAVSLLYRILDELSPNQRAIFVLVELEEMSLPEAAAAISENIHTVTSRLKVARQKFEASLRRHRDAAKGSRA
jgi:RNA polymerase sigma-70 factor (ECF subfamily)